MQIMCFIMEWNLKLELIKVLKYFGFNINTLHIIKIWHMFLHNVYKRKISLGQITDFVELNLKMKIIQRSNSKKN